MNEKQLQALARRNAAKAQNDVKKEIQRRKLYDATLEATRPVEPDEDAMEIFREMKKREF
jgi:tRNA U54 and U55 pseudouridine synthase Pus10